MLVDAMRFDGLITPSVQRRMLAVAREFRKEPTESEAILWSALRNRALDGHKFRRQQPIGSFIVDFYCDAASLVVEVDGLIHEFQRDADREREQILEGLGLQVLRVTVDDVVNDLPNVLQAIATAADSRAPSPRGRGG